MTMRDNPNEYADDAALLADRDAALVEMVRWLAARSYRFTTVTPATHRRVNDRPENRAASSLEDIFGWSRPFDAAIVPDELLALMRRAGIVFQHDDAWRCMARVSTLGPWRLLHSAFPTDAPDAVFFGPDTYRFVNALQRHLDLVEPGLRIARAVDIGAGAGPGAIAIAAARPGAEVLAADINPAAVRFAALNAHLAGTSNVSACRSDLLRQVSGGFDLIVSNPPYLVDAGERTYRHGGGPLGAGLSLAIIDAALERLNPGGTLLLYTGSAIVRGQDAFREAAVERLARAGFAWTYEELDPDVFGEELEQEAYAGADRIAAVWLTAKRTT
ncbi:Methyltransferase small domain-containing protein [Noviherbaspirillum humi]|uniref:Methyltransferase small domain-containing protein n=1 Tax=Noviherbaspirillum humi TaxID=1688639 RepID=A0A239E4A9_9BURK|nr:class I SAM-dependent methyltransferase [Noviherbaspirillum humi]SNS38724.1 Methyltransferase small domain-containing protein [Noviherbaspirillum humi]